MNDIIIYFFEVPQGIFEQLLEKKGEIIEKEFGKIEKRLLEKRNNPNHPLFKLSVSRKNKKNNNFRWMGKSYPKLNNNNINNILNDLINSIGENKNKKNVIIKFGDNYLKPFRKMINSIETNHPFVLFNFSENDKIENDFFTKFKLPQYISYIKDKYDEKIPDLNLHKIWSYIWEKDCYYNERGNSECSYSPANFLYKPSKGFIFYNILLIGESRAGKSTFINRMFNKFVTYEARILESATREITYYEFGLSDNNKEKEDNKLIKNGYGLIRILDTPGLVITKDLDASSKIIDMIDEEFDSIHMIYFFLKAQSNIEQCIETLKYIQKKNLEREKNNQDKVPIIFIKNGEDLIPGGSGQILFQQLKDVLKKYELLDLYDSSENKNINADNKQNKEINFLDDEDDEEDLNDYQNYIDENIIQIHLPTGKNLNKLFLKTKQYILKNNNLILEGKLDNEFNSMKKNAASLIKLYIKEKLEKKSLTKEEKNLYIKLYKECNEFALKLRKNCGNILFNLDILKVKTDKTVFFYLGFFFWMFYAFILPFFIAKLCIYIYRKNLISKIALSFGFSEEDIYFYGLDKYVFSEKFLKDLSDKDSEKINKKLKSFFEEIIYYIGPIQCALKTRDALFQIKEMFEKLSNKKDEEWNEFKVEKI